jgi:hypothetical protein
MQTFLASRVEPPFSGKKASGSVWAHSDRSCHPTMLPRPRPERIDDHQLVHLSPPRPNWHAPSTTAVSADSPTTDPRDLRTSARTAERQYWNYTRVIPVSSSRDLIFELFRTHPGRVASPATGPALRSAAGLRTPSSSSGTARCGRDRARRLVDGTVTGKGLYTHAHHRPVRWRGRRPIPARPAPPPGVDRTPTPADTTSPSSATPATTSPSSGCACVPTSTPCSTPSAAASTRPRGGAGPTSRIRAVRVGRATACPAAMVRTGRPRLRTHIARSLSGWDRARRSAR